MQAGTLTMPAPTRKGGALPGSPALPERALRGGEVAGAGHGWLSKCAMKPATASCVPMSAAV